MIDPKEAPPGYRAEETSRMYGMSSCLGCDMTNCYESNRMCFAEYRRDGEDVIFKREDA